MFSQQSNEVQMYQKENGDGTYYYCSDPEWGDGDLSSLKTPCKI